MWDQSHLSVTQSTVFRDSNTSHELWTTAVVERMNDVRKPQINAVKGVSKATESGRVLVFLHFDLVFVK